MSARITPGDGDPRHGTDNGYHNLRCRCDECRVAASDAQRRRRLERFASGPPVHGTASAYTNWGCRCHECVLARRAERARQRRNRERAGAR